MSITLANILLPNGAAHHCVNFSRTFWNTNTSNVFETKYEIPLAKPTLKAKLVCVPLMQITKILIKIAGKNAMFMTFLAIFLPISLTVRSVATTINGKLKAAHVIGNPNTVTGKVIRKLDSPIMKV